MGSNQGFFTVQQTCPQCNGNGEEITNPCNDCGGSGNQQTTKKISVTIPKGVDDGTRIRLAGKGEAGTRGGSTGDLYLFVNVKSHELFKRSDVNLFFEFPISIADAALGTTIEIPTIDGRKAKIKIPDGTQDGKQFRLKGKGMPFMRRGDYGDLYIQVKTEVPVYLNKEQKELLEKFRKIENEKSKPPPCISNCLPRYFSLITEHSKCHPGLPLPQGESHPGSFLSEGFHKTKSKGSFFNFDTSTLAPALRSSGFLFESF